MHTTLTTGPPLIVSVFSRSGGTLLARILGSDPGVVLLSEINPVVGATPGHEAATPIYAVKEQMRQWYKTEISSTNLADAILEVQQHCNDHDKQLVIRDWSHHNFVPSKYNGGKPSCRLEFMELMSELGVHSSAALVRDPIDVFISSSMPLDVFTRSYDRFVSSVAIRGMSIFRYEDMVANPTSFFKCMSNKTHIRYDTSSINRFNSNMNITGDTQLGQLSRGVRAGVIKQMPRKWIPAESRRRIERSEDLLQISLRLGYGTSYNSVAIESWFASVVRRIHGRMIVVSEQLGSR